MSNHRGKCNVRQGGSRGGGGANDSDGELSSGKGGSGNGKGGSRSLLARLIHPSEKMSVYADPTGKKCKYCKKDYSKSGLQKRNVALSNHVQLNHPGHYCPKN